MYLELFIQFVLIYRSVLVGILINNYYLRLVLESFLQIC